MGSDAEPEWTENGLIKRMMVAVTTYHRSKCNLKPCRGLRLSVSKSASFRVPPIK